MDRLTPRQTEIVRLACIDGLTNPEIGQRLSVSFQTIKNHRSNIFRRLDVQCMQQVCYRYGQLGGPNPVPAMRDRDV